MKLTESQQKALNQIKDYINLAKECETIREYYIREHTDDFRDRKDYESIVSHELERFSRLSDKLFRYLDELMHIIDGDKND